MIKNLKKKANLLLVIGILLYMIPRVLYIIKPKIISRKINYGYDSWNDRHMGYGYEKSWSKTKELIDSIIQSFSSMVYWAIFLVFQC